LRYVASQGIAEPRSLVAQAVCLLTTMFMIMEVRHAWSSQIPMIRKREGRGSL
jgi:hypothetical protein